jgi:hypothetical protein
LSSAFCNFKTLFQKLKIKNWNQTKTKGEIKMKNYSLAALQMAFLGAELEREEKKGTICWEDYCGYSINDELDSFVNLTTESEFKYA